MFKHILLPTDGSPASSSAIKSGIEFAKGINASVTGLHIIPEFHTFTYQTEMLECTREDFDKLCMVNIKKYLSEIEMAAKEAGVKCDTLYAISDHPYEAIIKTAVDKRCDLIGMASHGRKGVKGLLLGSETQKVLTNSKIPVLVLK